MDKATATAKIEVWESSLSAEGKAALIDVKSKRRGLRTIISRGVNKMKEYLAEEKVSAIIKQSDYLKDLSGQLDAADASMWALMTDDDVMEADVFLGERWSDAAFMAAPAIAGLEFGVEALLPLSFVGEGCLLGVFSFSGASSEGFEPIEPGDAAVAAGALATSW